MSQSELGGDFFDRGYVSAVEVGRIQPSLGALIQFARTFDISLSTLLRNVDGK